MVFQGAQSALNPVATVYKQFYETMKVHVPGVTKKQVLERSRQVLEIVNLDPDRVLGMYPHELSGGMKQRIMIAFSLLLKPEMLILDEPTAGLDPKERARFRNILSTLSKDRIVILSTHIVSDIESNANQVILLKERKLYRMDTVSNICKTLDGKVYECVMEDRAFDAFQDTHLILSVRQEQEQSGQTLSEFVEQLITDYYNMKENTKMTGDTRTLATQIPEELFERLKAYLKKNNLKQKQFIIGLIEDALEQEEEDTAEQPETEESDEPDMDAEEE